MNFADYIAENQQRLEDRRQELLTELAEVHAELFAIQAYETSKRDHLAQPPVSPRTPSGGGTKASGRYPHKNDGTLSVPQAGREFLGLSASGSWLAARRGDIPTIKISRYRRVPVAEMRRKMEERAAAR